jgi:hypothetical protein
VNRIFSVLNPITSETAQVASSRIGALSQRIFSWRWFTSARRNDEGIGVMEQNHRLQTIDNL